MLAAPFLKKLSKNFPSFLTAIALGVTIWILAVTAKDPTENRVFPRSVPIEVVGQDTGLVLTSDIPNSITITLSAPQSVWTEILSSQSPIRAIVDLSGLGAGAHDVDIQVQVAARPVQVVTYSPKTLKINMESLSSRVLPVTLLSRGVLAVGYQAEDPVLNANVATITGPSSQVARVEKVQAILDINQVSENIARTLDLTALDANGAQVDEVTITPGQVSVDQTINQKYGYRNVIVSVKVEGQVADGYRMTNISVFPLAVTVFSPNPDIVNELPGFVQTRPINLTGLKDDIDISMLLDLPEGVSVVGDKTTVLVRVSVAAVQSSLPVANIPIEIIGLPANLKAILAPETVTLILSGPLPELDLIQLSDIQVTLDLTDFKKGTYQLQPMVKLMLGETTVTSVQPEFIDVQIITAPPPTPVG